VQAGAPNLREVITASDFRNVPARDGTLFNMILEARR
jgi:hypothetical protein